MKHLPGKNAWFFEDSSLLPLREKVDLKTRFPSFQRRLRGRRSTLQENFSWLLRAPLVWLPDIDFSLFSSEQPPGNCGGGKGLRRVGQQHNTLVRRHSYSS
ncbi:MAG: hypothetical protein ACRC8S_13360, partial [Fimbriiglobus sp.]